MTVEEIIARAICNRRKPKPVQGDAYDNLSGWAVNDVTADAELREFDLDGEAVVAALDAAGYVVAPKESNGPMWVAGRKVFGDRADDYARQDRYEMASAIADRSPEAIYAAMIEARPK